MELLSGTVLWPVAIFTVIFILLVDLMHRRQCWTSRYPPGPVPWPVVGNLLQVDVDNMPYSFYKLQNRYGDVFSLQMGWNPMVIVNGLKAVQEALVTCGENTADRPEMSIFLQLGYGQKAEGVVLAPYGPKWREQRRFSVSTLRNFGLGKKSLERWVTEEAGHLCDAFTAKAGSPFNPYTLLDKALCNVISSLIYGHRFEYEDPDFIKVLKVLKENIREKTGLIPEVVKMFPILLRIPGLAYKIFPMQKTYLTMVDKLVTEHKRTWDPDQPPRDLTDAFMAEMEKAKGNPESSFNEANLFRVVLDLFGAGTVTSSTTLTWALLLMILHPDVQSRVQEEINEVIGQVRRPEMADQARMPYTNAVIHEVQRFADISPMTLPHRTSCDIEVQGFLIPKGTTLIANLSSVLKDETVWEKPLQFYPEHFLDAQGHFVKPEAFMPFSAGASGLPVCLSIPGILRGWSTNQFLVRLSPLPPTGRRACLGEPLARMELFLFFTCLLRCFSFSVPDGQPLPSDYGIFSMLVHPAPYQLCAVVR